MQSEVQSALAVLMVSTLCTSSTHLVVCSELIFKIFHTYISQSCKLQTGKTLSKRDTAALTVISYQ